MHLRFAWLLPLLLPPALAQAEEMINLSDSNNAKMRDSWKKQIAEVGLHCPSPTGIEYIEDNARGIIFKIHCAPTDESNAKWALRVTVREDKTARIEPW